MSTLDTSFLKASKDYVQQMVRLSRLDRPADSWSCWREAHSPGGDVVCICRRKKGGERITFEHVGYITSRKDVENHIAGSIERYGCMERVVRRTEELRKFKEATTTHPTAMRKFG